MQIATTVFAMQMSTKKSPRDMNLVADTGPFDWDAMDSDHRGEEAQAVEAGGAISAPAERELQAAHPKDPRREAEK